MSEQDLRILKTVRILKTWTGNDHQARRVMEELCGMGYLERVPRHRKGRPENSARPDSYRLTERGRAATNAKHRGLPNSFSE